MSEFADENELVGAADCCEGQENWQSSKNKLGGEWLESSPARKVWGCCVAAAPQEPVEPRGQTTPWKGKTQMDKKCEYPAVFRVLCPILDSTIGKGC